ncbi:MAG: FAD-dependent oxidoreductase, partial [Proteobacteria bacterium]|nr:FAD-dependent oxidoreductase [Pseudomonadota bacterium]
MDKKYGVYICTGCGIGEALDIEKLSAVPKEVGVGIVKTHPFLCGKEGLELLKQDIAGEGVNSLVIGACSRRVNFDIFRFDGCIVDRVNLREQVVWTHPSTKKAGEEGGIDHIQMMAEDYLKMGVIKIQKITLPEPYKLDAFCRKILVIGGGIAGISAAIDAAKTGYEVTIVEKENSLGGYAAKVRKQLPVENPFENIIPPVISDRIKELESLPGITVKTNTIVARIAGQPG